MPRKKTTHATEPARNEGPATAYSYLRFSSPEQARGDSIRRQTENRDAWLTRSGAILDTSLSLRDEGVSAFTGAHRQNPDRNALAAFLELVRQGRVKRGSYLIVESLDRLSREHIRPALTLLLNLIDQGIRIVQLLPVEMVYDENVEPMSLMMAIMELSRGHSESAMKSERIGGAWDEKKRLAAEQKVPLTRRCPAWLRVEDGEFVVIEERAEVVRRIYREAIEGFGLGVITKRLNADQVPALGLADYWGRSYVAKVLNNRAVFGEYQPHTGRGSTRRKDGEPIPAYYPEIVSEETWHAAQAALSSRRMKEGRPAKETVNVFAGLLKDAVSGSGLYRRDPSSASKKNSGRPVYISTAAHNGAKGARRVGFSVEVFERAVLGQLREIDPLTILPDGAGVGSAAQRALALEQRLGETVGRIERLKAQMVEGEEGDVLDVLRSLGKKRDAEAAELELAQREAASPLTRSWGECKTVLEALEQAPNQDEARLRLRAALRRVVEGVWCVFAAVGSWRMAAVQVRFAGGAHRDYFILHRGATGGAVGSRPAQTWVQSFKDVAVKGELDLRDKAHAARLASALEAVSPEKLAESTGKDVQ